MEFKKYKTQLPHKQASSQLILLCMKTSYDYLSASKIQDDIVVGGIIEFQMYQYPEPCKGYSSKWKESD